MSIDGSGSRITVSEDTLRRILAEFKLELIDELKRDFTIAIVTHNMQQAARCADQVAFFYLGEMVEVGTATQMFTSPRARRTQEYITGRFG